MERRGATEMMGRDKWLLIGRVRCNETEVEREEEQRDKRQLLALRI